MRLLAAPLVLAVLLACAIAVAADQDAELNLALRGMHPRSGLSRLEAVRHVLKTNPKAIAEATDEERGPLSLATRYHDLAVVKLLLEHGADANEVHFRETVLHVAVEERQHEIAALLIEEGAKQRQRDLTLAANLGQLGLVKLLLASGSKVDQQDDAEMYPLQAAAEKGCLDVVRHLVELGADVDAGKRWMPPLHLSARAGYVAVARLLLDKGAAINREPPRGHTPVQLAVLHGRAKMLDLLLERGAAPDAFALAARGETKQLQAVPDLPAARLAGETLLQAAARFGRTETAQALLDLGVDVNVGTDWHGTPLHIAAARGDLVLARLFLERGAAVNSKTKSGETPLHAAAAAGRRVGGVPNLPPPGTPDAYPALVQLLLKRGADVNAPQIAGLYVGGRWRPIHCAAAAGRLDLAKALVAAGSETSWNEKRLHLISPKAQRVLTAAAAAAKR